MRSFSRGQDRMMIRIDVVNDSAERWVPVIQRSFEMTLAPFQSTLGSLRVELSAPESNSDGGFRCSLAGATPAGRELSIVSRHEVAEQAIVQAFTRARRELRRGQLRPPVLPGRSRAAGARLS
jgi:hypothetical protein